MKKFGDFVCKHKLLIVVLTILLMIPSLIGMYATKINYDILVYLPEDIETVKGQNILSNDFNMGSFSITILENMSPKEILKLEDDIRQINGVEKVVSIYDALGSTIPLDLLPSEIGNQLKNEDTDLMMITYRDSTSSEATLDAVEEVKRITKDHAKVGGMSAMVLDTMHLSETEILIYIVIAVILCVVVLEIALDSYIVPLLLLANIGISILFNLGTNIFLGEISYITKALVAVLQLGVTTDFSIFLYHAYESKKEVMKNKEKAMSAAITETFTSVVGSSLTTIAGFLVLCTMQLQLGTDLGLVMAKGVFLGVVCVLTIFPSLLLLLEPWIQKTKHKKITLKFNRFNQMIIKRHKIIFVIFLVLLIPAYLASSKVGVYYKLDESLPKNLDSIVANQVLAEKFNIVSPEIILVNCEMKPNLLNQMIEEIENLEGIDFVLSASKLEEFGISKNMLSEEMIHIFESNQYQMLLVNSTYGIATDALNAQVEQLQTIVKKYDQQAILAGEGPLMKDLISISNQDFNNVNNSSIICIFVIMLLVLKSGSLPILLILAIESAIFMNLAIPYFGDITLPFVAPIVLGTIQLGATIDYAILMTTTYLKKRKEGFDKKHAMEETLNHCESSILVSGLCFFAATFGVGVYSALEMISSLCTLISRGAIISMLVVIGVLPSILLVCDQIIMKTTIGLGGERMKKKLQKFTIFVLLVSIFTGLPVSALSKEETVYVKLKGTGEIQKTFVKEHLFNTQKLEEMKDLSDLQNILNLNGNETVQIQNNHLLWNANGNDIFYRGDSEKDLPISLKIAYYLNGEEYPLEEMIGKKGTIRIEFTYQNQDAHTMIVGGREQTLYTPFTVMTATILDNEKYTNVAISNGKIVNNGKSSIVVGLSVPGLSESLGVETMNSLDTIQLTFDTDKFELANIYSIITPIQIDNSNWNILSQLSTLENRMELLTSSTNQLEEGAGNLVTGAFQILDGNSKVYENLVIVVDKIEELQQGTRQIDDGLQQILEQLEKTKGLLGGSQEMVALQALMEQDKYALSQLRNKTQELQSIYQTYHLENISVQDIMQFTADSYASLGMLNLTENQIVEQNVKLVNAKLNYESSYESNLQMISLLEGNISALDMTIQKLQGINVQVENLMNQLIEPLVQIKKGTSQLINGIIQLQEGLSLLTNKVGELKSGADILYQGSNKLFAGITTLNEEGIRPLGGYGYQFYQFADKIETLLNLSNAYQTFTMKPEEITGTTKFIYTIDSVKTNETKPVIETEKPKESLWVKIKNLFH